MTKPKKKITQSVILDSFMTELKKIILSDFEGFRTNDKKVWDQVEKLAKKADRLQARAQKAGS